MDEDGEGPRSGVATIRWLRSEFVAAARKQARPGTARLLAIDVSQIPTIPAKLPDVDARVARDDFEDVSGSGVLRAYEQSHLARPGDKLNRRVRLMDKQLQALTWLEQLIAQRPQPGDGCGAWFSDRLDRQLGAAGIFTLAQLAEHINGLGRHWYRSIKSIGPTKAKRIEAWLREHGTELRLTLGQHVTVARSPLRPLEKFIVPVELDGSQGAYRQPQSRCLMRARNDYDAILAWLQAKPAMSPEAQEAKRRRRGRAAPATQAAQVGGFVAPDAWLSMLSHTQRAYRKEAERFLLWAILERGKPLSSMTTEDCTAYRDFLANPPLDWCGPRGRERWSPLWRPFEGPLSVSARRHATTILKNLYGFLTAQNYLMGNPWSGVAMPRANGRRLDTSRSFTETQWLFILKQFEDWDQARPIGVEQPESELRLLFILNFLYTTGLRLSEAVHARVSDLRWVEYPPGQGQHKPTEGWELTVDGKGGKLREVIVPTAIVELLKLYLKRRGLGSDPGEAARRLLGQGANPDPTAGLAESTLYSLLKHFFKHCAGKLIVSDAKEAERFRRASTHWLRHAHASHGIAKGVPLEVMQANLGHASLATTTVYVTTEKARRMRAMQRAWR
ncbi:unnamed protein product [Chondrus crispus]|uniref:Tyr recombinase domain-containing protein n=1 Tax=Chondrus crispus TaxID=2769 RepID=R7QAL3_CHOCR|nr:unnamed protein product [Chondrus crispus]CDF34480.1 unnamed protein product [Chondrus crispus]|eukprot:XP_005714299.1 unnamed protein product [Chondrus crispus]